MQKLISLTIIFFLTLTYSSCQKKQPLMAANSSFTETDSFKSYWYNGLAEINSYQLSQSRYGETREGKAVLIFVTEDFSEKKQVKLDDQPAAGDHKISVLKMNFTKNFVTGIYPYSMMLSAFTPISSNQYPATLKLTMSSQEWCGQVFTQVNWKDKKYAIQSNSYFEKEGDEQKTVPNVLLEDELWNRIRLGPEALPTGKVILLPGLFYTRLLHTELAPQEVNLKKEDFADSIRYTIQFEKAKRTLAIVFEKKFPFKILGWEEQFTERSKPVITRATLIKTIRLDYWTKNKNEFNYLRDSLGLQR
ncbi:MAG: hypothetical protein HYZ44_07225 [Bacteroidetes bacterium]|nr:hypothetical protein [Bacteroidota bacterium]